MLSMLEETDRGGRNLYGLYTRSMRDEKEHIRLLLRQKRSFQVSGMETVLAAAQHRVFSPVMSCKH